MKKTFEAGIFDLTTDLKWVKYKNKQALVYSSGTRALSHLAELRALQDSLLLESLNERDQKVVLRWISSIMSDPLAIVSQALAEEVITVLKSGLKKSGLKSDMAIGGSRELTQLLHESMSVALEIVSAYARAKGVMCAVDDLLRNYQPINRDEKIGLLTVKELVRHIWKGRRMIVEQLADGTLSLRKARTFVTDHMGYYATELTGAVDLEVIIGSARLLDSEGCIADAMIVLGKKPVMPEFAKTIVRSPLLLGEPFFQTPSSPTSEQLDNSTRLSVFPRADFPLFTNQSEYPATLAALFAHTQLLRNAKSPLSVRNSQTGTLLLGSDNS